MVARLAARGARVLDADDVAHRALEPGTPAHRAVREAFGPRYEKADGTLDRALLARLVFADAGARATLEAIVHPVVEQAVRAAIAANGPGEVLVVEAALLVERDARRRYGLDGLIVVDAPEEVALARLVGRGMDPADARARLAAQASRGERLRAADYVILNVGTLAELDEMADAAWAWIGRLADGPDAESPSAATS